MYNLLIVDDERIYNESVAKHIRRTTDKFNVITAKDGLEALGIILNSQIHAMILDIEMPHMNGLELLEELKRREITHVFTIILSGHDAFDYARDSLKLGVMDYMLKPMDPQEIEDVCRNLITRLESIELKARELAGLQQQVEESKPIIKERFFLDIITQDVNDVKFKSTADFLGLNVGCWFCAVVIEVEIDKTRFLQAAQKEMQTIIRSVELLLEKQYMHSQFVNLFHPTSETFVLLYSFEDYDQVQNFRIDQDVAALHDKIFRKTEIPATIGIGENFEGTEKIAKSYYQALSAINYKLINGFGNIYNIIDFEKTNTQTIQITTEEIVMLMKTEQISKLLLGIKQMFAEKVANRSIDVLALRLYAYKYLTAILTVSEECGIEYSKLTNSVYELPQSAGVFELEQIVTNAVISTTNELCKLRKNNSNYIVEAIKEYIFKNYQNDFSNSMLADSLGYSVNYIGQVFKIGTGKTINEYINLTRIDAAKKMLKGTVYKITDISSKVGFSDQQYFGMVFKKHVGVTPTEYRTL